MMARAASRKLGLGVSAEMADKLKELSVRTDIPQARLLRQALELLFTKYEEVLKDPKPGRGRK